MTDDLTDFLSIDDKKQLKPSGDDEIRERGRPRKDGSLVIAKRISVGFTADEYEKISDHAGSIPLASLIKMCLKEKGLV